jgi:hypothetical protein
MAVVVRPEIVNESVAELIRAPIHEHFAGYLCMLRTAVRDGTTQNLRPRFDEFFDTFLRVPNAPDGRPYLRPFARSSLQAWNQPNVAGSYAGSSIRPNAPFRQVVDVSGARSETRYSLRDQHPSLALAHLANGKRVPVVPLAIYLYRDFGIEIEGGEPGVSDVVKIFRYEFGYEDDSGQVSDDFEVVFSDESDVGSTADMFEEA